MSGEFDAVRVKVSQVLANAYIADMSRPVIQFENQSVSRPQNAAWLHFSIAPNWSGRINIGLSPKRFRHMGVIIINCMVPENHGTKLLNDLLEKAFYAVADKNFDLGEFGYLKLCYAERRNRGTINGYMTGNIQLEYHQDVDRYE